MAATRRAWMRLDAGWRMTHTPSGVSYASQNTKRDMSAPPARRHNSPRYRLNSRSTRFRLLPTRLTAPLTSEPDLPVIFASYLTSCFCPPATRAFSCLRPLVDLVFHHVLK